MIKNKIYPIIIIFLVGLSSCSEYQKVLSKGTVTEKYKMANELYDSQKYSKALRLFEKIIPSYRGKPQMERIQYMVSQSYFNTKQYSLAAYYFEKFTKNYPKSSKVEEALYLSAYSYYLSSPVYSLDQADTKKAITAMQNFISKYPNSVKIKEANKCMKELNYKLEKKAFEVAKLYYNTQDYIAAVAAFDYFLKEYLGSTFKEQATFYKFKSGYELGINSIYIKKKKRIENAIGYYNRFAKNFPKSPNLEEATKLVKKLKDELKSLNI